MKLRQLATALAVTAPLAAPAFAAESSGSIGISASEANYTYNSGETVSRAYTLDGSIAMKASDAWTVTIAGSVSDMQGDLYDYTPSNTARAIAVAATYNGADWRAGPFVSDQDMTYDSASTFGAVAEKYIGDLTLGGAVAHSTNDMLDLKAWSVVGEVRYFVQDNLYVRGGASWTNIDGLVFGTDVDSWNLGVGAEYQFTGTRWTLFGGYDHGELDDIKRDNFKLGVRMNFGGDLKARVRSGADLPIVTPLASLPMSF